MTRFNIQRLMTAVNNVVSEFDAHDPLFQYLNMLRDFDYCINCIQYGVGNRERNDNENPEQVLQELREEFNFSRLSEHTANTYDISQLCKSFEAICSVLKEEK